MTTPNFPEPVPVARHRVPLWTGSIDTARGGIGIREKLSYALGDIGSNVIFVPATSLILFYLTDVVGMGAAIAGTLILIGQLLNGITDLTIGVLIDRTSTVWGKTRPWVILSSVPLAVSFVLLFSVPSGLSETGQVVWTLIFYSLVIAVFFTSANVAYSALLSVMTPDPKTRVTLTTFRFFAALLAGLVVGAGTLPLVEALGNGQEGWTRASIIYGVICVAALSTVFFGTRERVRQAPPAKSETVARQPLRQQFGNLARNKYFFLAAGLFLVFYLNQGLTGSAGVYYATEILGDSSVYSLLSIAQLVPPLIGLAFMPAVIGRIGKRKAFLIGTVAMFVGAAFPLLDPSSITVVVIGVVIRGIALVPFSAGLFAIVADVVDYGEWRFGERTDGLIFSGAVIGQKIGGGLGSALVGWILALAPSRPSSSTYPSVWP